MNALAWLILTSSFISMTARADFIIHTWEDHFENKSALGLNLNETYYSTSSNFSASGTPVTPTGLINYTRLQTDLSGTYGILEGLTAYLRLNWAWISINGSINPGAAYNPGDQTAGLNYRIAGPGATFWSNTQPLPFFVDLQFQSDFPLYSTATSTANLTPYPGDGSVDLTGGLIGGTPLATFPSSQILALAGAGYTYRTLGFSSAIPWMAQVKYQPQSRGGLTASFSGTGVISLKTDPNASGLLRSNTGSGGSFYIGATNPSIVTLHASLGYQLEKTFQLTVEGSQAIWGQAAPDGFTLAAGVEARWGESPHPSSKTNPARLTPSEYGRANQGFVTYALEATVLKSNDRMNLVKINKGSQDGVEVGQFFDIFATKKDGSQGEVIARGQVTRVKPSEAALEIKEYFREVLIDEGYKAKGVIQ